MLFFPPALQAPTAKPQMPPQAAPKADLPPGFKDSFRFVVRPWGWTHLGSLGPREKASHTWELENVSGQPIVFKVADLSPGVVVAGDPFKEPIPAHGKRAFTLQTDTTDWEGFQQRGIRLVSDDPKQPAYKVLFDMTVRPDLTVDAVQKKLGGVAPYESPQAVFHFKRETGDPLEIKLASQLPAYVETELVPMGSSAELRLTLRASKVPAGQLAGLELVKVATNAPKQPAFDLYLDWSIALPVQPAPSRLVFDDPKVRDLKLTLTGGKDFKILTADLQAEGFSLSALPAKAAKKQTLTLHRDRDGAKDGFLLLTLSGVEDPLKIPVIWADPSRK
ncbi:MAG TPA: hypothetical protein VFF77_04425 [Holophagaceae bacterium]|jgi:hypothetical protein|nr:hypothetical protein [Holophagaceae bacterium]